MRLGKGGSGGRSKLFAASWEARGPEIKDAAKLCWAARALLGKRGPWRGGRLRRGLQGRLALW